VEGQTEAISNNEILIVNTNELLEEFVMAVIRVDDGGYNLTTQRDAQRMIFPLIKHDSFMEEII
jgi:hypothetical protein